MNIPSFKLRKELSSKDKHYLIYGLLIKKDYKIDKDVVSIKKDEELIEILKKYKVKFYTDKTYINFLSLKERFFRDKLILKDNKKIISKYIFNRMSILGIILAFKDSYILKENKDIVLFLSHFDNTEKLYLLKRLQDYKIYGIIKDDYILIDKTSLDIIKFYIDYYIL